MKITYVKRLAVALAVVAPMAFGGVAFATGNHQEQCNNWDWKCGSRDVCSNIEGNQEKVPEGYFELLGKCYEKPVDKCLNIPGFQHKVPEGKVVDEQGNCNGPLVDVCKNVEGVQTEVPADRTEANGICTPIVVEQPPVVVETPPVVQTPAPQVVQTVTPVQEYAPFVGK
jgi:hypothetical protein